MSSINYGTYNGTWAPPLANSNAFLGLANRAMMLEANRLQLEAPGSTDNIALAQQSQSDCSSCTETLQKCMNPTQMPRANPCICPHNKRLENQVNQTCGYLYNTST